MFNKKQNNPFKNWVAPLLAGAIGSVLTLGAVSQMDLGKQVVTLERSSDSPKSLSASLNNTINAPFDFSPVADKVTPTVVHIKTKALAKANNMQMNPFGDMFGGPDIERFFFGEPRGGNQRPKQKEFNQGSGSGVIISADGYIVTNNHVVANADEVEVVTVNNKSYKAKVVGTDPSTDLAVLQIKESGLSFLKFGNSDQVKVGNWVLAVGNPFNLASTVTAGVVSAKGRNLNIIGDKNLAPIESFLQTDAAVNPGNSGGALVSLNGDLIGINTAIASPTGSYSGYAFAVPSRIVEKVVADLIQFGVVQRGFLGVMIRDVTPELVKEMDLDVNEGAYVDSVNKEGAGNVAGILKGDIIIKADEMTVKSNSQLLEAIGRKRPGDKVNLVVKRGSKTLTLPVTLKNKEGKSAPVVKEDKDQLSALGLEFGELTEKDKKKADVNAGVRVTKINPGKVTQQTDMREGFIITQVDKEPVKSVKELEEKLSKKKGGVMIEGVYTDIPGTYYYAFGL